MKKKAVVLLFSLFVLVIINSVIAAEPGKIISNSQDWRDVYSVMEYATLTGKTAIFLVSDRHATIILSAIPKGAHIWAISSKNVPFIRGYKTILENNGYTAEEFEYANVNLELAKKLDVKDFIIVDDSYGYNAISVAPYAAKTKAYVLFVDKNNLREVDSFLQTRGVNSMLIYGFVDREVRDVFSKYNPEILNKNGDRFLNNIEIVKKYQEKGAAKQVILTNGEFIEQEIMSGAEPVVFIGTQNVPESIKKYIKESGIDIGVLIGNELVGTATKIRRQLGISVFVKFAQGARAPKGRISQVEALDMFYLPAYTLNLELMSMKYNTATKQVEATLKNTEEQAVYSKGTYTITAEDGSKQVVGDIEPVFIDGKNIKTMVYDVNPIPEGNITANAFIIYGESPGSMEKEIRKTVKVERVNILDKSKINITEVSYDKGKKSFYVTTKNTGKVGCYVNLELVDVSIAGETVTLGMKKTAYLDVSEKKKLRVKADLTDGDIADNELVKVRAYYGEREDSLVNTFEGEFELLIVSFLYSLIMANATFYLLLLIIIILIMLIIWKRYKSEKK